DKAIEENVTEFNKMIKDAEDELKKDKYTFPRCANVDPGQQLVRTVYVKDQKVSLVWNECGKWVVPKSDIPLSEFSPSLPHMMIYRGSAVTEEQAQKA